MNYSEAKFLFRKISVQAIHFIDINNSLITLKLNVANVMHPSIYFIDFVGQYETNCKIILFHSAHICYIFPLKR